MNIVLIGYRGTGKSEVGLILSRRLGMSCVAIDAAIVEQAGMTIPEIVETRGWQAFRDLECELVRVISAGENLVIDTGGGVIERGENITCLRKNARVIWLKASVATIVSRIEGGAMRPPLTAGKTFTEEVADVLERRTPTYRRAAHHEIETDELTPEGVADAIIHLLNSRAVEDLVTEQGTDNS